MSSRRIVVPILFLVVSTSGLTLPVIAGQPVDHCDSAPRIEVRVLGDDLNDVELGRLREAVWTRWTAGTESYVT